MAFESPSDRLASGLRRFFLLRRISGTRLGRLIWIITLFVYGSMILLQILRAVEFYKQTQDRLLAFGFIYNFAFTIFNLLVYILLVRLAIEVAFSLLERSVSPEGARELESLTDSPELEGSKEANDESLRH